MELAYPLFANNEQWAGVSITRAILGLGSTKSCLGKPPNPPQLALLTWSVYLTTLALYRFIKPEDHHSEVCIIYI